MKESDTPETTAAWNTAPSDIVKFARVGWDLAFKFEKELNRLKKELESK